MNYRLNALGFAHISEEKTNFGLFDQKHAIEWVHRHIRSFGGDPVPFPLSYPKLC
jgi:para-nitrobenzyl esterase